VLLCFSRQEDHAIPAGKLCLLLRTWSVGRPRSIGRLALDRLHKIIHHSGGSIRVQVAQKLQRSPGRVTEVPSTSGEDISCEKG
jgi:hypothetical protein